MMRKMILRYSLLVFALLASMQSVAALRIDLTQGISGASPLAVVPFSGQNSDLLDPNNIAAVVAADLRNSGQFDVLNQKTIKRFPVLGQPVVYSYWRKQGVDNIVIGSTEPMMGGHLQVKFELINVYQADSKTKQTRVLLNQKFVIRAGDSRPLAHHIADLIYQKLTGQRGVFSTKIAYVIVERHVAKPAVYRLQVADADGYQPQTLLQSSQPIMSPSWSPDGKSIAYVSFENKRSQIFVVQVIKGKRRLLTAFPGINGAPAWSPNGKKLAIVLSKGGHPNLYEVDLANGKLRQLTYGWSIDTEPAWSPDGQSIIFTSDRGGAPQIYQIKLASKKISRLTFSGSYNARASFTPDGKRIVMLHRENGLYNIAEQDLQSGRVTILTRSGLDESPSVAPNGNMVIYATQYGGRGVLAVVSIDGRVRLRLPAQAGAVQEPSWSPFLG